MKENFKELTYEELEKKYEELRKKYLDFRFNKILGHVSNNQEGKFLRRNIARLNTIMHEYDLGIRK
jgi:large subunit ribosomal protein L29